MLNAGEIESDKLTESGTEKEEKEEDGERDTRREDRNREEEEGSGEAEGLIKKSHVVVKRRPKKGRSNRHQQVRNNKTILSTFCQSRTVLTWSWCDPEKKWCSKYGDIL